MDIVMVIVLMVVAIILGFAFGYIFARNCSSDGYDVAEDTHEPLRYTITTITTITDENGGIINEEETEMTFEA